MGTSVIEAPASTAEAIAAAASIPATDPAVVEAAPTEITYDLKLPGDLPAELKDLIGPDILERTVAIARARGLDNEAGQSVLDFTLAETKTVAEKAAAAAVKAAADANTAANQPGGAEWVKRETAWRTQAEADPTIGGTPEKLGVSVEKANQAIAKYGTPELKTMLDQTGLGSHPQVLRLLANVGRAMSEPTLQLGGSPVAVKKDVADLLYGGSESKPAA
jgi:hypothetical protein